MVDIDFANECLTEYADFYFLHPLYMSFQYYIQFEYV